jgi:hypothetical protein
MSHLQATIKRFLAEINSGAAGWGYYLWGQAASLLAASLKKRSTAPAMNGIAFVPGEAAG